MHLNLCFCHHLFSADTQTNVVVLMQSHEQVITSGTAHLIPKLLNNAEIRYHGHHSQKRLFVDDLIEGDGTSLLLYPFSGAEEINETFLVKIKKPVTLFVPDGNWRQTAKMIKRTPALLKMKKVMLPQGAPSSYRLRKGPTPDYLCTYEAVARALGVLESKQLQENMERIFNMMVERVLWTRGKTSFDKITL